jgi:large subunit ribosomal protein L17
MRHQVHGKKLNRSSGHRKALFRNLVQSLVEHERITTTLVKAKAMRPYMEKLITRAKSQDLAARRAVAAFIPTSVAANKVVVEIAPRFVDRPGGYTRITKLGRRTGDGAEMAIIEFVTLAGPTAKKKISKSVSSDKKAEPVTPKQSRKATATSQDSK